MAKIREEKVCAMHLWRQIRGNLYYQRPDTVARCVYLIENRPGGPHIYDRQIRKGLKKRGVLNPARIDVIVDRIGGPEVVREIIRGLAGVENKSEDEQANLTNQGLIQEVMRQGLFRDTEKIRKWIANENNKLGLHSPRFETKTPFELKPLELVIFHAHCEIDELYDLTVRRNLRPAAIVASGSGEMVPDVYDTEWFQKKLAIIQWTREKAIPYFGICFGHQALGYQMFGVMPIYHTVPAGVTHQWHLDKPSPVTPGARRRIYGRRMIIRTPFYKKIHDVMNGVDQVQCLEAHSMGFELSGLTPTIPLDTIQAASADRFYHEQSPTAEIMQLIVEVIADGCTVGVQAHPELTAQLLILLLELLDVAQALEAEGYNLDSLREELRGYRPDEYPAGDRLGHNFFKYVMTPNLIAWLRDSKRIDNATAKQLLDRRFPEDKKK